MASMHEHLKTLGLPMKVAASALSAIARLADYGRSQPEVCKGQSLLQNNQCIACVEIVMSIGARVFCEGSRRTLNELNFGTVQATGLAIWACR